MFQDCQNSYETVWRNNNTLSSSDNNLCTRNDHCVNGTCKGTPCLECESCKSDGCAIKPGFCVDDGKCYCHGHLRPGNPCQLRFYFITANTRPVNLKEILMRNEADFLRIFTVSSFINF